MTLLLRLLGFATLATWTGAAYAQTAGTDEILTYGETRYVCTGVAEGSRDNPEWQQFPLKLVFADADGAYLASVGVTIRDSGGTTVLDTRCDTPWVLVDLPAADYDLTATADGRSQSGAVTVDAGPQAEHVVRFAAGS